MKGYLSNNQIEYVFFHLNLVFHLSDEIKSRIVMVRNQGEIQDHPGMIVFLLIEDALAIDKVQTIRGLPVLFPGSQTDTFWSIQHNTLVFEHDLLKSAFYLLSGFQETVSKKRDVLGRFSAADSLQLKLGIMHKPVVNYYFDEIKKGIQAFLLLRNITLQEKSLFHPYCFLLTHDVDRVRLYSFNYLVYKLKELIGIKKTSAGPAILAKQFIRGLYHFIFLNHAKDPAWDFEYLRTVERKHQLVSAFYFLDDETRPIDADYSFNEKRIGNLINSLHREGCEIGMHGNQRSVTSKISLINSVKKLHRVFPYALKGIRQHRLRYEIPVTTEIQEECGFQYDTSLGFYDHEGFRNSFCLPFKLYDFNKDQPSGIWEIPLLVMDCTLLEYRNLSFEEADVQVNKLLEEVRKFSGVFTLLWHNGYFDEVRFPGIHGYYENLIAMIIGQGPENKLGSQVIDHTKALI